MKWQLPVKSTHFLMIEKVHLDVLSSVRGIYWRQLCGNLPKCSHFRGKLCCRFRIEAKNQILQILTQ